LKRDTRVGRSTKGVKKKRRNGENDTPKFGSYREVKRDKKGRGDRLGPEGANWAGRNKGVSG